MYVHQYISLWCVAVFQYFLTTSLLLLLLNLIYFCLHYNVLWCSPILFAGWGEKIKCKFPTTPTVHRCTGYVFVCVCRCVHTSVHVTKPPLTQSMTPFFLIYVHYSVLMYLYSVDSHIHHVYAYICMYTLGCKFVHICVHMYGNLQYTSQYPTHSMYVVVYYVIYIPTYVHQCNVTLGHTQNNFL